MFLLQRKGQEEREKGLQQRNSELQSRIKQLEDKINSLNSENESLVSSSSVNCCIAPVLAELGYRNDLVPGVFQLSRYRLKAIIGNYVSPNRWG